jgi:hypothetical protein
MKSLFSILITLVLLLGAFLGASKTYANSLSPVKQEITIAIGERTTSTVTYTNESDQSQEIKLSTYEYNPRTDSIFENKENIFLKVDTDTITVQPNESKKISYEIYPLGNTTEGTYFNIIVLTPTTPQNNISLAESISQLVVLHLVKAENYIEDVTTKDYIVSMDIIDKGIPFLQPIKIKYTLINNSNFVLTPDGNIEVYNSKGKYPSYTQNINRDRKRVYPNESLEEEIEIIGFNISDLISERTAVGHIYNGLDSNPQNITKSINSYKVELLISVVIIFGITILMKSIKSDYSKKEN